ncbi:MAG: lipoate--protein ligase [Oscillospiraceae bacterium]
MTCRYYITGCTNPYQNLALEEVLLRSTKPEETLLYLWQNDHTVVIGRNQDAWRECRVEKLQQEGGRLARRLSGGGAVYHDMGNQNFTFFSRRPQYSVEKNTEVIRLAAASFGIQAERSGRNDILAEGRKFSGNAFYKSGPYCYHHGTVLVNSDMGRLGSYLNPSPEKLAGKGVASVQARVVNLSELVPGLTAEAMRAALVKALGQVCGSAPVRLEEDEIDKKEVERLQKHYEAEEWRLGVPFAYTTHFAARLGFGEIDVQLLVEKGRVRQAKVYSDAMDSLWVQAVEKALAGAGFTPEGMKEALGRAEGEAPQNTAELARWLPGQMV